MDNDHVFLNAIQSSTIYSIDATNNFISFYKDYRQPTITLAATEPGRIPTYNSLDGPYKLILAKNIVPLALARDRFSINGNCNTYSFGYLAYSDGSISFSDVQFTRRFCKNDTDKIFFLGVLKATRYIIKDGNLRFFEEEM